MGAGCPPQQLVLGRVAEASKVVGDCSSHSALTTAFLLRDKTIKNGQTCGQRRATLQCRQEFVVGPTVRPGTLRVRMRQSDDDGHGRCRKTSTCYAQGRSVGRKCDERPDRQYFPPSQTSTPQDGMAATSVVSPINMRFSGHGGVLLATRQGCVPRSSLLKADCKTTAPRPLPLIPAPLAPCQKSRVVCSDGTWMAPSDVHVRATGAWKESEMGSRSRRPAVTASGGASAMAPSRRPPRGTGPRIGMGQTRRV
jgi:hypothetical protein